MCKKKQAGSSWVRDVQALTMLSGQFCGTVLRLSNWQSSAEILGRSMIDQCSCGRQLAIEVAISSPFCKDSSPQSYWAPGTSVLRRLYFGHCNSTRTSEEGMTPGTDLPSRQPWSSASGISKTLPRVSRLKTNYCMRLTEMQVCI